MATLTGTGQILLRRFDQADMTDRIKILDSQPLDSGGPLDGGLGSVNRLHRVAPSMRATLRKISITPPPAMRYPSFRAFWFGMVASVSGFQILRFAQFWLIFEITGSPLALGYVGLANGIPAIVLNLFGGVAADRLDQRRLIMVAQAVIGVLIFGLATLTLLGNGPDLAPLDHGLPRRRHRGLRPAGPARPISSS